MIAPIMRPLRACVAAATLAAAASTTHLLLLLLAAVGRRRGLPDARDDLRLAIVIPAHDEEGQIAAAVRSVQDADYPQERRRIIVVADNCTDRTADVAAAAGAEVWERTDAAHRGKGHALAWAFDRLFAGAPGAPGAPAGPGQPGGPVDAVDAVCVIDADCEVSSNLLRACAARLGDGADAVQASYRISDPERSPSAALRWAGFALFNVVRPLGREQLGLSAGLLGTGMAISRRLLAASPWQSFSFAEDREQHMRWVLDGARVAFASEATVRSPAAGDDAGRRAQEARWESGRLRLAARLSPALVLRAVRDRDPRALDAALEPVLPPQSLLLAANLTATAVTTATRAPRVRRLARASLAGQIVYVLGSLTTVRAPRSVWRALLSVPLFVLRRLGVLRRAAGSGGPAEWERTARASANPSDSLASSAGAELDPAPATESRVNGASSTEAGSSALAGATTETSAASC